MLTSLRDGYNATIIGSTGGIGKALMACLKDDPRAGEVSGFSRSTAPHIDLTDEASLKAAADIIRSNTGQLDVLIIATGILKTPDGKEPEKAFSQIEAQTMQDVFAINTFGPALVLKHFLPLMSRNGRTIIAALSARVGSIGDNGLGGWISYRASKAALNQIIHTAAIEQARRNAESLCVALHPGTVQTPLSASLARGRFTHEPAESAKALLRVLDALSASETGGFFDYSGEMIAW